MIFASAVIPDPWTETRNRDKNRDKDVARILRTSEEHGCPLNYKWNYSRIHNFIPVHIFSTVVYPLTTTVLKQINFICVLLSSLFGHVHSFHGCSRMKRMVNAFWTLCSIARAAVNGERILNTVQYNESSREWWACFGHGAVTRAAGNGERDLDMVL